MIVEVKVPSVGESVTSGVVSAWHKKSGEFVNEGEPLFALKTDKVSTDIVADKSGVLETKVPEGQEVKIGEVIAIIDDAKQAPEQKKEEKPPKKAPDPRKKQKAISASVDGEIPEASAPATNFSPAVRRIVEEEKIEPEEIVGTGLGGRLTKTDALKAVETRGKTEPAKSVREADSFPGTAAPSPTVQGKAQARFTRKKMSPLRRKIAQQLVMAQHTAAILTTFNECDMSAVQELRRNKQDEFTKKNGVKLGLMSFFVKACVEALKAVPVVNGRIEGDDFIQNNFYDIGVAVGTERGLVVPVLRDADRMSLAEIEAAIADFGSRARGGRASLEELQGGTFTSSNGGIYGSLLSTPILNAPQSGILSMHRIEERAVVRDGQIVARPMMYLALSYDHRLVDGKEAVTFLVQVKEAIEDPKRLVLDL